MSSNDATEDGPGSVGPSADRPTPPQPAQPPQTTTSYPAAQPNPTTPYAPAPSAQPGLYQRPHYQSAPYQPAQYQQPQYQPAPYQAQPYPPQPYQAQPYQAQPYPPQPYQAQPYQANWAPAGYAPPEYLARPRRRIRRIPLVVSILALVVAVGLGVVAVQQYQASRTPAQVVQRYFAALTAGKASDALDFAAVAPRGKYLTATVLAEQAQLGRITDVRVINTNVSGSRARVDVDYTLALRAGNRLVHDVVPLVQNGSTWKLSSAAVLTNLGVDSTGADRVLLAGAALPTTAVYLFPGVIPVSTDSAAVQVDGAPNLRLADGGQTTSLSVSLTKTVQAKIVQTLRSALDRCLTGKSTDPDCPQSEELRQVPDTLRGTAAPTAADVTIQLDSSGGGEIQLSGDVTVKGSWQVWDFNNQAVTKSGNTDVAVHAVTSVADPSKLYWRSS